MQIRILFNRQPLATLVGVDGKVITADLQPQMLAGLQKRAERAGLLDRIQLHMIYSNLAANS